MNDNEETIGTLSLNVYELDVWLHRFFERVGSYALDPIMSEHKRQFISLIVKEVSNCLVNNVSHTITTDFDSAGRAKHTFNYSIDNAGVCFDLALATMERNICCCKH